MSVYMVFSVCLCSRVRFVWWHSRIFTAVQNDARLPFNSLSTICSVIFLVMFVYFPLQDESAEPDAKYKARHNPLSNAKLLHAIFSLFVCIYRMVLLILIILFLGRHFSSAAHGAKNISKNVFAVFRGHFVRIYYVYIWYVFMIVSIVMFMFNFCLYWI